MVKKSLISIISLIFTLSISELLLRSMGFSGEREWTVEDAVPVIDEILDYRLKPYSLTSSGQVSYQLNGRAFRDVDRKDSGKGRACRLVVAGDSVAYGYKVEFEKIFARRLETMLKESQPSKTIEVFNLALPGVNTLQESQLLIGDGSGLNPDLIILAYVLNDADVGVSYRRTSVNASKKNCRVNLLNMPIPCALKSAMKQSAVLFLLKDSLDFAVWKFGIGDNDDPSNSMKSDYFSKLYKNRAGWEKNVVDGFKRIRRFAEEKRSPVMMVIFPIMFDFADYKWRWIHQKVAVEAEKHGFHVIDLLDQFSKYPVTQTRLERGDFVHPNALGHSLAASSVMNYLKAHPQLTGKCADR